MKRARVLVVDDSVVVRRLVSGVLGEEKRIDVVGTAPNGRIALDKIAQLRPDLVVLDIEMPEMDGLTALAHIKADHPGVHVVMFSILTVRGAAATLDALSLGAVDYVTKPGGPASQEEALFALREQLVPKILALCAPRTAQPAPPPRPAPIQPQDPEIVCIAASTGGPDALTRMLGVLPKEFLLPVLVVQHMPAVFTRLFAKRLNARVRLDVAEATPRAPLRGGHVWIAPGDFHLAVSRGRLRTHKNPPVNSCRPSADVLFRSVASEYGPRAVAVVLSGMGRDGFRGAELIHEAGGRVLAQDQESCAIWGMPRHVVRAGIASLETTPEGLGQALRSMTRVVSS